MALASLQNIEKTFGARVIFDQLCFAIDRGERVGLIGDNGSGKSTLFKILTGQLTADDGERILAAGARLGHLAQDPVFNPDNSVMDEAELAFAPLHELSLALRRLEHEMGSLQGDALDKILKKYQDTQHDFELAGGYAWRHRLEAMLAGVGLPPASWEQNVATLSGGQRSRLALAKLLIDPCDLLLLDEPTNHLDLAAIAWLEDYLATFSGAVLIISHDRYLLDRLATRIVWLTAGQIKSYPGNYSAFVQQRQIHELSQQRAYDEQQADIAKQSEFVRRFRAGQRAREAKGRQKRLDRLLAGEDLIQNVRTSAKIRLPMQTDRRAGDRVLRVKELGKSFGPRPLWQGVTLDISRGERIGLIGPNASGKTTLLETLLGHCEPDAGEFQWGANLRIGYYDQTLGPFDPDHTVAEEVQGDRTISPEDLRSVLALMLFRGSDIDKPIRLLSGGERARVAMAQLLIDRPNVLILDEPTNHLDIQSCEALERALGDFAGTILCVSHDRYFLDKIVRRLLVLVPPQVISFDGNFTAWSQHLARKAAEAQAATSRRRTASRAAPPVPAKHPKVKSSNPWSRPFGRLSVSDLEKQITQTESQIAACQQQMGEPAIVRDPDRGRQLVEDHEVLAKKLRELEEEYYLRGE
jgi:ATP-binding cassette subfamily F protein 3